MDPDLEERALEQIQKTESAQNPPASICDDIGKFVMHPVFGKGVIIGLPRDQSGVIIQFDNMVTPRTFGSGAKLQYL
jgi:hypothetical protein